MAIVTNNPLVNGFRGMLGNSIVFKTLRGKTIIANRPSPPKKQSELQRTNRSKFREATAFAKAAMKDPVKKNYYYRKAKELKLPNAYTAAITDYMRKPEAVATLVTSGLRLTVRKHNFAIKKTEIVKKDLQGNLLVIRTIAADKYGICTVILNTDEIIAGAFLRIEDNPNNTLIINPLNN